MTMSSEEERRAKAAAGLDDLRLNALLVTSLHNVRYLTGFTGSNAIVLLESDGTCVLFTDPRYTVQSKQQATCKIVVAKGPLSKFVVAEIVRSKLRRVAYEQDQLTVAQFETFEKELPSRVKLKPARGTIERQRMVKDAAETAKIRDSVITNSNALEAALSRFKAGMTEQDLAAEIDYRSRKAGAEAPAFDTIVAAGVRAALPHARPGSAPIETGMLLIDMGAFREGYASDMTRMAYVGKPPAKFKKSYAAVLEAQLAAIDAVKPGVTSGAVDRAARSALKKHGLAEQFIHSTGHGLGLEIHEPPRLGGKDETKLEAGMAITIEPGVYVEGWGGIRIEDTVLVTENGCEILTPTGKDLRLL